MPTLAIAHIREQGVDLIIAPLASDFGLKAPETQRALIAEIQLRSRGAGLAGTVVPVWDDGAGRMAFIAPRPWHPFFKSIGLGAVQASVNQELSW